MRKLFFLLLMAAVVTPALKAVNVENTAGQLAQLVTDTQITELTVTGTMDARDFLFINEHLTELTSLDLSQVTITAVDNGKTLFGTVTGYSANQIPRTAFFGKKLTTVALPETIESIGYSAFAGCYQLTSVTLPKALAEIDDYAFSGTALTSIEIPANVGYMGKGAFSRCESLESAVINGTTVGDYAFLGDFNLSNVQIGADVSYILKGAFNGCKALQTINIDPASTLIRIDDEAFINSGLESINIKSLPMGTIGEWAFAQTKLTSLELPGTLTNLGEGALAHNPLLTKVTMPDIRNSTIRRPKGAPAFRRTLEYIKDYTFAGDEQLNPGKMLIYGVKSIGSHAFYNVSQDIDTMYLPSSVHSLGDYAMAGMTGMQVLKTDAVEVPALGNEVWAGVDQPSIPLIAPEASVELYKAADQWMNFFFEESYLLGDVNRDGVVNISDVTALISYSVAGGLDIDLRAADINSDGSVNISDVTALISMVMGSTSELSVKAIRDQIAGKCVATSDVLSLESVSLQPGQTRTIDVALNNDEHDYTAMQCELVLPQGVTLTAVDGIERCSDHSFFSRIHEQESNVYTLIGASMKMDQMTIGEGKVLRLTITADEDFDGNNAELMLANVRLVTPDHEIYLADDAAAMLNNASGIEQVNVDKEIAAVRYINVAGQESDTPFDGMNIVVTTYVDGTTTTSKVLK